jgi:hypothetical protein
MPSTHTRLKQAHDLWHRALAAYADVDEFALHLNQLIVTLRQVTFMVQNHKHEIADFDKWYGAWQERMAADPIMKWMRDARTHVEHVGDLDVASTARVSVIADWLSEPYRTLNVPPSLPPEAIALAHDLDGLQEEIRKEGLLRVERQWVSKDFPDHELLDMCAHSYGIGATIVAEAHQRLGTRMQTFGGETHEGRHVRSEHLGGRLPCMVATADDRTAHVHIASGELIDIGTRTSTVDAQRDGEAMAERAIAMAVSPDAFRQPVDDPLDLGGQIFAVAKRVLAHDGYHRTLVFMFDKDDQPLDIVGLNFVDQPSKYLQMRALAADVARLGAHTVAMVGETWGATVPIDEMGPDLTRPRDRPDRVEELVVQIATADGRRRCYAATFGWDANRRPVFRSDDRIEEGPRLTMNSFEPIRRVRQGWPRTGTSATERPSR